MPNYENVLPPIAPPLRNLIFPTPADLVDAPGEHLDPCGMNWNEDLAPHGHWRIKCLRIIKEMGHHRRRAPRFSIMRTVEARQDAIRTVPKEWVAFCPPPEPIAEPARPRANPWKELHEDRVRDLYQTKEGISFQKAALVYWLIVRHVQCEMHIDPAPIFGHVRLTPLAYTLDGFTKEFFEQLDPNTKKQIAKIAGGGTLRRLEKVPQLNVTFCCAQGLYNFLSPNHPGITEIEFSPKRLQISRTQKIWCPAENP